MSNWVSCTICGKKANGDYNARIHRAREHPAPEWFASMERAIERLKAEIDTVKEHQQEYESLGREYQKSYPAVVLRAIDLRIRWLRQDWNAKLQDLDTRLTWAEARLEVRREKSRQTAQLIDGKV